ncbi:MAG: response regulator [Betaproteobacteria bacterium]|nr:MAG: response regulator [Betaproteobacteria bacterium]TAN55202.1 MAG: response regulator [Betaproteobacteria bacterium]
MNAPISVLLVDDHTLFRKGLAELLEGRDAIRVVAATGDPDEALRIAREQRPDVAIVDLNMPPHGGLALLRQLLAAGWQGTSIVLTVSDAEDDMANALASGARGYLLKDMEPDELVAAVRRALRGETVVAPAMTLKLIDLLHPKRGAAVREDLLAELTPREREILQHLAQGLTNKAIARALDISHETVKLHVRRVLAKLKLSSRVEAAVFAVEHGVSSVRRPPSEGGA